MKIADNAKLVIDEGKIAAYLLNKESLDGKPKAEFFFANGITPQEPAVLETLLIEQARTNHYTQTQATVFGLKYIFETELLFPNGRKHFIRSVWIEDKTENVIKFVTAYKISI